MERVTGVTLKDVAKETGFSLVSVHRALNGKTGVSQQTRDEILRRAKEMGYQPNVMASALKRRQITIAIVLPARRNGGARYFDYMWKGCEAFQSEISGFGIHYTEYEFDTSPHGEQEGASQLALLQKLAENPPDGLLTSPVTDTPAITEALQRLCNAGTRMVLIENDLPVPRLCCVAPNDENTGRLGAEFMCDLLAKEQGSILVVGGNRYTPSHATNAAGFADYVRTHRPDLGVIITGDDGGAPDAERYASMLEEDRNIVACYSVRAKSTVPLCNAALRVEGRRRLMLLGSDLFPESAEMLRRGVLRGIIYKNPYEKGYRGLKTLEEALRSGSHPVKDNVSVPIFLILRSNLVFFEEFM